MIDIPMEHERNVCGQFDAYLKKIERTLHVTMITRDGVLKIIGPEQTIRQAKSVFNNLLELSKRGNTITEQNVDYALSLSFTEKDDQILEIDKDIICRTITGKPVKPKTMGQKQYVDLIRKKMIVFGIGPAGTGKTYLAAFDVKAVHPKRMLFVVHRRSIALKAMETFKTIIKDKSMGLFSGDTKEINCDYVFSTIQTIYKPENRQLFPKEEFDYIIIDEVHKAGANSYQELVNYFKPQFLLGMSATPERSDDFDIYKMFDYNIAYEIRLQQAMEYDLLCPFHYYGITDMTIDDHVIDDKSDFNLLVDEKRVDYVIDKINDYGYSGDRVHGLIFVSRKEEAHRLSEMFNQRGFNTYALTGEASEKQRQEAMDSLESNEDGSLDYIFTVDIFNEGIDIPKSSCYVKIYSILYYLYSTTW